MFALWLVGCSSWIDQQPACEYDVYDWSDDLLAHVLTGDGSGSFDYDPEDVPRKEISGKYDPETGDFSYDTTYAGEYWIQFSSTEGYGTVFHNGNLDLLFRTVYTDILGQTWADNTRVSRNACDMTVATYADDHPENAFVMDGSYADDTSWLWFLDKDYYSYSGGMRQNLSRSMSEESTDGSFEYFQNTTPEGVTDAESSGYCQLGQNTFWCETESTLKFDGGVEGTLTAYDDAGGSVQKTCTWAYDYGGQDDCEYSCDDGSSPACR